MVWPGSMGRTSTYDPLPEALHGCRNAPTARSSAAVLQKRASEMAAGLEASGDRSQADSANGD